MSYWPLMKRDEDYGYLIDFLKSKPRLTQGEQVKTFERPQMNRLL